MFPGGGKKVRFWSGSYIFVTVRPAGLEVIAYLPPPLLSHLRIVLAGSAGHKLTFVDRWQALAETLDAMIADVVVLDPCAEGVSRASAIAALLDARPALPVVVYTPVSPLSFQAIAELARRSAHHAAHQVVLHRYDDEPRRFLDLLERQPGTSMTAALLEALTPTVATLPPTLSRAIERLMQRPGDFRDVADLARAARITVRTAYRHLTRAGFRSPRGLVVAARLLQAYGYSRDPRQSLAAIASRVGYSAPRMLTKHMRDAVGATPRSVRRQMRPSEFVHALARWLAPPDVVGQPLTASVWEAGRAIGPALPADLGSSPAVAPAPGPADTVGREMLTTLPISSGGLAASRGEGAAERL